MTTGRNYLRENSKMAGKLGNGCTGMRVGR